MPMGHPCETPNSSARPPTFAPPRRIGMGAAMEWRAVPLLRSDGQHLSRSDAVPRTNSGSDSSFPAKQEAGEIVVAASRMSSFRETATLSRPFGVDSKRSSHVLSLVTGDFHFPHVTASTIGLWILRNNSGQLCSFV
jgi:hypothetical protein